MFQEESAHTSGSLNCFFFKIQLSFLYVHVRPLDTS